MKTLKKEWDRSYARCENFIFYPKEEVVKFLNRFVRKKIGIDKFIDIIDFSKKVRGLDYGCGIGRQTILMEEFGIESYGVDISKAAIKIAKRLAIHLGYDEMVGRFTVSNGAEIPFKDKYFDITISKSVLDSMPFELAQRVIREIGRVTKRMAFISLIFRADGKHKRGFNVEKIVGRQHEKGTIQSYYNFKKIQRLLEGTNFKINRCSLIIEKLMMSGYKYGRYYLVLQKDKEI